MKIFNKLSKEPSRKRPRAAQSQQGNGFFEDEAEESNYHDVVSEENEAEGYTDFVRDLDQPSDSGSDETRESDFDSDVFYDC